MYFLVPFLDGFISFFVDVVDLDIYMGDVTLNLVESFWISVVTSVFGHEFIVFVI